MDGDGVCTVVYALALIEDNLRLDGGRERVDEILEQKTSISG